MNNQNLSHSYVDLCSMDEDNREYSIIVRTFPFKIKQKRNRKAKTIDCKTKNQAIELFNLIKDKSNKIGAVIEDSQDSFRVIYESSFERRFNYMLATSTVTVFNLSDKKVIGAKA